MRGAVLDRAASESQPDELAVIDDAVLRVGERREAEVTSTIQSMYFMHSIVQPSHIERIAVPDPRQATRVSQLRTVRDA